MMTPRRVPPGGLHCEHCGSTFVPAPAPGTSTYTMGSYTIAHRGRHVLYAFTCPECQQYATMSFDGYKQRLPLFEGEEDHA